VLSVPNGTNGASNLTADIFWEGMMTSEQRDKFRKELIRLADRTAETAAGLENQVRTPTGGESAGGISNAPLHLGDIGSEAYNQELGVTLLENETYIRDEALAALERLNRGTFGTCESCHEPIPVARLNAIPYARYCAPCAERLQAGRHVNLNEGRPATWLGEPGHEGLNQIGTPDRVVGRDLGRGEDDIHAAGTPGGGSAVGGLAGTNVGGGSPSNAKLEDAMGSGNFDVAPEVNDEEDEPEAFAGPAGGAVGGTPANKRARGGQTAPKTTPSRKPKAKGAKNAKGAKGAKGAGAKQSKKAQGKTRKK
jgi:RNA polymerase-binding transcription factor DksA